MLSRHSATLCRIFTISRPNSSLSLTFSQVSKIKLYWIRFLGSRLRTTFTTVIWLYVSRSSKLQKHIVLDGFFIRRGFWCLRSETLKMCRLTKTQSGEMIKRLCETKWKNKTALKLLLSCLPKLIIVSLSVFRTLAR